MLSCSGWASASTSFYFSYDFRWVDAVEQYQRSRVHPEVPKIILPTILVSLCRKVLVRRIAPRFHTGFNFHK
jgi:hypothetical protein